MSLPLYAHKYVGCSPAVRIPASLVVALGSEKSSSLSKWARSVICKPRPHNEY